MRIAGLRAPEADTFAAVADAVVAPEPPLPRVADTDAVAAFAALLAASPALNRLGLRALLRGLAPLRKLDRQGRGAALARAERGTLGGGVKALRSVAHLCYYGDPGVLARIGYDHAGVVARGHAAREAAGRW